MVFTMMTDKNNNQRNTKNQPSFMEGFFDAMAMYFPDMGEGDIAVGVSGGADSMALCFAMSEYFKDSAAVTIHALSVDHGLRAQSLEEVQHVAAQLKPLPNVEHYILTWAHETKPDARIQEKARFARYDLMKNYMRVHNITMLFLGHHMDDQAETFLFRLAKGSGVDGLSCMSVVQKMENDFTLCRPMLGMSKGDMISFCEERGVDFINDPSNDCDDYARVRLRKSRDILAEEGLSSKRLSMAAKRFSRARKALDLIANDAFYGCSSETKSDRIVFGISALISYPEEIVLRVILKAIAHLQDDTGYGTRLERVENLCADLMKPDNFRKRTLGGIIFECRNKDNQLILSLENPS